MKMYNDNCPISKDQFVDDHKNISEPKEKSTKEKPENNHSAIKPANKLVCGSRKQEGNFHVFFRGNSKHTIFYNDEDFILFLKKCDFFAQKYDTKIIAFVLMDNHVHIHLETKNLTTFMTALLIGFARSYNKRKGLSDKIFRTPFSSSQFYSKALIIENLLYIFSNPINAGICSNPWEYKWSSYHFHNAGRNNPLRTIIDVDTSFVDSAFPNKNTLDKAIVDFIADISEKRKPDNIPDNKSECKYNWPLTPDYEVIKHMDTILAGRQLFTLSKEELKTLMIRLRREKNATYRQIATLTHGCYEEVRRICQLF